MFTKYQILYMMKNNESLFSILIQFFLMALWQIPWKTSLSDD